VTKVEQARQIVLSYHQRWTIEQDVSWLQASRAENNRPGPRGSFRGCATPIALMVDYGL